MNNIDINIVAKYCDGDATSVNEINETLTNFPCDKSIMNGPCILHHMLCVMDENNNHDSTLNTTTTTNCAKVFIASTHMPCMNSISSCCLQNNNNQGCAAIVHVINK